MRSCWEQIVDSLGLRAIDGCQAWKRQLEIARSSPLQMRRFAELGQCGLELAAGFMGSVRRHEILGPLAQRLGSRQRDQLGGAQGSDTAPQQRRDRAMQLVRRRAVARPRAAVERRRWASAMRSAKSPSQRPSSASSTAAWAGRHRRPRGSAHARARTGQAPAVQPITSASGSARPPSSTALHGPSRTASRDARW